MTVDFEKYGYSGYGLGFDRRSAFLFPDGGFAQNVLIFGADMGFSAHIHNKKKDILVLGIGPIQGLEHTLIVENMYSINFTVTKRNFVWGCITMEQIVICLNMAQKFTNLKQKILKL